MTHFFAKLLGTLVIIACGALVLGRFLMMMSQASDAYVLAGIVGAVVTVYIGAEGIKLLYFDKEKKDESSNGPSDPSPQ